MCVWSSFRLTLTTCCPNDATVRGFTFISLDTEINYFYSSASNLRPDIIRNKLIYWLQEGIQAACYRDWSVNWNIDSSGVVGFLVLGGREDSYHGDRPWQAFWILNNRSYWLNFLSCLNGLKNVQRRKSTFFTWSIRFATHFAAPWTCRPGPPHHSPPQAHALLLTHPVPTSHLYEVHLKSLISCASF